VAGELGEGGLGARTSWWHEGGAGELKAALCLEEGDALAADKLPVGTWRASSGWAWGRELRADGSGRAWGRGRCGGSSQERRGARGGDSGSGQLEPW
jgi:hypothetical protein